MGMGVSPHAPAASTPGKDPVPIVQEAGWVPGPVCTGGKSRPQRDSIPDRPARSSVAIPSELPGPRQALTLSNIKHTFIYEVRFVLSKQRQFLLQH